MADEEKTKEELEEARVKEERKNIDVTNNTKEDDIKDEDEEEIIEEEKKEEDEKKEEKTDEEKEAEKLTAKEARQKDRVQKRIDKAVAEAKAAKAEAAALRAQLDAKPNDEKVLTEEEVERRSETKAAQLAAEREFTKDCNKLADDAEKVNKNFSKNINELTKEIGAIPSQMIGILSDLDNGGKVLNYLSEPDNIEEAEELWKLSSAKMALRLSKLSLKLEEKPKKEISKLPEPNKALGGKSSGGTQLNDKMTDQEWIEKRNKEVAEKQAIKRASYR